MFNLHEAIGLPPDSFPESTHFKLADTNITCHKFSPFNEALMGNLMDDGTFQLVHFEKGQVYQSIKPHSINGRDFTFSQLNRKLLCTVGLDKKINCIDVDTNKVVKPIDTGIPLTSISFSLNGYSLAVGSTSGVVKLFDLRKE